MTLSTVAIQHFASGSSYGEGLSESEAMAGQEGFVSITLDNQYIVEELTKVHSAIGDDMVVGAKWWPMFVTLPSAIALHPYWRSSNF